METRLRCGFRRAASLGQIAPAAAAAEAMTAEEASVRSTVTLPVKYRPLPVPEKKATRARFATPVQYNNIQSS